MVLITIIVFTLCTILPLFHVFHAIGIIKDKNKYKDYDAVKNKKGISVLIPCYNEQDIIKSTIYGVEKILEYYPNAEFIFINDGSKDDTLNILIEELHLKIVNKEFDGKLNYKPIIGVYESTTMKNTYVINKVNGGKADSLNAGIDFASNDIIVTLDADTILEKDALHIINYAFEDKNVIAAGGLVNIIQGGQMGRGSLNLNLKYIVRFQIFEYLKGFMIYKASLARANALAIISGAFGVFRKNILIKVGGYRNTIGEDIDITMKFQKYILENKGKKILFLPNAICYTECPENWRDLYKQRIRWQKAFIDCVIKYFWVMLRTLFSRSVSFFFLIDAFLVGTIATALTLASLLYLLTIGYNENTKYVVILYIVCSIFLNLFYGIVALYVSIKCGLRISKKSRIRLIETIIGDLLFFRFVSMFYVVMGSILYFVKKDGWNKVQRTGNKYFERVS
jgi:poly-beta-1,6-N-acetyl-D-glucosamine synthase